MGFSQKIYTEDISRFWKAYDKIVLEKDSTKQVEIIKKDYINVGTEGLKAIMEVRRYSAEEYVYAINHYPKFWNSVRANTLKSNQYSQQIKKGIKNLKKIYPDLKPADVFFEIGILRTGGTTLQNKVLIGAEIALADSTTIYSEIDSKYPHLKTYFAKNKPSEDIGFNNLHEFVHTQQKETIGKNLLAQTMMEGVAEFVAELAYKQKSPNPQIDFGYKNEQAIKREYEKEMFSPNIYNWIMNNPENKFGMRDLGYFVGYAICKKYYDASRDKKLAVKKMIELDYNSENDLMAFVENTNYFEKPIQFYKSEFEENRPKVVGIKEISNSESVSPSTKIFTILFSKQMNPNFRSFDYGPLGEENVLKIKKVIGFSEDKKSFSFEADLSPEKHYQILVDYGFRSAEGLRLRPYLIDFKTSK